MDHRMLTTTKVTILTPLNSPIPASLVAVLDLLDFSKGQHMVLGTRMLRDKIQTMVPPMVGM
jgi:hypothetical protein